MNPKPLVRAFGAAIVMMVALAVPVSAHGDHDARPLAREVQVGPYTVSLWQVYPDAATAMTPHLIVMFERGFLPVAGVVSVAVNSAPMEARRSSTTSMGWETAEGVVEGDVVAVTVSDGSGAWDLDPVVVPAPQTSMLPMQELIYVSIVLTLATALWLASRTARTWRRPAVRAS